MQENYNSNCLNVATDSLNNWKLHQSLAIRIDMVSAVSLIKFLYALPAWVPAGPTCPTLAEGHINNMYIIIMYVCVCWEYVFVSLQRKPRCYRETPHGVATVLYFLSCMQVHGKSPEINSKLCLISAHGTSDCSMLIITIAEGLRPR